MASSYSTKDLRVDLIVGPLLLVLFVLAWQIRPRNLLTIMGLFALAGSVLCMARAYYEGTTLLYNRVAERFRLPLELIVIVVTWMLALYQFLPGASLGRLDLDLEGGFFAAGFALVLGWIARALTGSSQPVPRMRAYLVVIVCLTLLLGPKRYGYSFGSSDQDGGSAEIEARTPEENKDWALFRFLIYTATCFVGVASVTLPGSSGHR